MSSKKYCKLAGRRLKELRLKNNLSVIQLAKLSKISPQTVRRIETGNYDIHLFTIYKLCRAFKIKELDFFQSLEIDI